MILKARRLITRFKPFETELIKTAIYYLHSFSFMTADIPTYAPVILLFFFLPGTPL